MVVDLLDALPVVAEAPGVDLGVHVHVVEHEHEVIGRERMTVGPLHALAQMIGDARVVIGGHHVPGDVADDGAVGQHLDEVVAGLRFLLQVPPHEVVEGEHVHPFVVAAYLHQRLDHLRFQRQPLVHGRKFPAGHQCRQHRRLAVDAAGHGHSRLRCAAVLGACARPNDARSRQQECQRGGHCPRSCHVFSLVRHTVRRATRYRCRFRIAAENWLRALKSRSPPRQTEHVLWHDRRRCQARAAAACSVQRAGRVSGGGPGRDAPGWHAVGLGPVPVQLLRLGGDLAGAGQLTISLQCSYSALVWLRFDFSGMSASMPRTAANTGFHSTRPGPCSTTTGLCSSVIRIIRTTRIGLCSSE